MLFPFYRNGSCILCDIIFFIICFSVLQEWLLYSVLYHIDHTAVPELQEWFLYSVLYHIDHMAVPGLQEWCLHNVSLCCEHLQRRQIHFVCISRPDKQMTYYTVHDK